ncbi:MAG: DUF5652 family protein [Bacteroidota bacterium]|nr:DUF5652 family protein [Bacteroidota bacterium]
MNELIELKNTIARFFPVIIILVIWEVVWKLIGLWKSARNKHLGWFIIIAIINSMGVLPIIYILRNRKQKKNNQVS